MQHNREMVEAMIAKGADIKATDGQGSTTLMWAVHDDTTDPAIVSKLLELGVDPAAKNKSGETALLWALRRGYTPVVEILKKAGVADSGIVQQSVEKAVALLQKSSPQFVKVSGCASCHHQSLPIIAYSAAQARGYAVNAASSEYAVKTTMAMFKPSVPDMAAGKPSLPDPAISVSYALVSLAAVDYPRDATTDAMAHLVSLQQQADGSFLALPARPPMESSSFSATALSVRAIQVYGKDPKAQIERARQWLTSAKPLTAEEHTMQLLGLAWANAEPKVLQKVAQALLAEQRPDGGWAQLTRLDSDAYATGQAMVALKMSRAVTDSDAAWQRAKAFLLRTQLEDGSWLVHTRTIPFQPYKESGFPHGKDQWISAAGTSWAAWALSLAEPGSQLLSKLQP
jgi:N-acyl-D-amino-acid deacylase